MTPSHNHLADSLSLDGEWHFTLADQQGAITVPGTWEAQGYPRRVDGPAVYTRRVYIPAGWQGKRAELQCDAASYHAEIAVNGQSVGMHKGLWTPFAFEISAALHYGADNDIRITLYKPGERYPMRQTLAGFLPDVMLPFGGLWQSLRLVAFDDALRDLHLKADAESGAVYLTAAVDSAAADLRAQVIVRYPNGATVEHPAQIENGLLQSAFVVSDIAHWGPGHPAQYQAEIVLRAGDEVRARVTRTFGFRRLHTEGDRLLLNGQPVFLRGILHWGWYPDILCPAPDDATIRAEFQRVRELGFNLVKLCLFVPSPRYFEIADEEGMLLWLELPLWLPQVTDDLRQQAPAEYTAIMQRIHHHPSVIIVSLGCELSSTVDADLLSALNDAVQPYTGGALLCDNSGSGEAYGGLAFDYADFNDYHFYCDWHYFDPLVDHFSRDWRPARPWIFGEFCDADDYRDLGEVAAAHGGGLPWYLKEQNPLHPLAFIAYPQQRERMAALDLQGFTEADVQRISRQQSFTFRKVILEKVRARASMGGYVVTSIRETPLATSSVIDELGRTKYDPAAFSTFNADSVLLIQRSKARRWLYNGDRPAPMDARCFAAGQPVSLDVILSHVGPVIPGGRLEWQLQSAGGIQRDSVDVPQDLHTGPNLLCQIVIDLPEVTQPEIARLEVTLSAQTGSHYANHWNVWLFPKIGPESWPHDLAIHDPAGVLKRLDDLSQVEPAAQPRVLLTSTLDAPVLAHLDAGGRALLLQTGHQPLPALSLPFWREALHLPYPHPLLDAFPHLGYAGEQFYALATEVALDTSVLAAAVPGTKNLRPMLRRLDARHFTFTDYLVEFELERGHLIATTLNFQGGQGDQPLGLRENPAARWLLWHLLTA